MYEIQKLYIDYENALIKFDVINLEEVQMNPFLKHEEIQSKFEPRHEWIEYDCTKGEEVHVFRIDNLLDYSLQNTSSHLICLSF